MKKRSLSLLALLFAALLALAACSGGGTDSSKDTGKKDDSTEKEDSKDASAVLPMKIENDGEAVKGGTLQYGMVTDSPFQGVFSWELYDDAYDSTVMGFATNSLFDTGEDFLITDEGIGKLEVDADNNKATITIRKDVKWSDGEPLKIEDLIYPYEIIADKDYPGVRYDGDFRNIVGVEEFHDGKADTISGLKKVDDTTLEISFKKLSPAIYSGGDGLWGYAAPKHQLESIAVADLLASDAVRKNPVTLGAFKFEKIVPGESVQFAKNEHYWRGEPKLDKIVLQTVPSSSAATAIKSGKFDIVDSFPATQYDNVKDLKNIDLLGRPELAYSYLSFKLGKYDKEAKLNITDENAKMNDKDLRQAIGYAMDIESVTKEFYQGLRVRGNSLIPPVFASFYDDSLEGITYDAEKAKKLLEEAGYKDVDGDGIREDKDGKPFTINLASMSGSDTDEAIVEYYRQNWKDVGLDVQLTTGRLIEFQSFYDKVKADDPEIDMFMAAWGTGTNPSPAGLYGKDAEFNFARIVTDDLTKMLADIDSKEAMDADYRAKAFRTWQEYMADQATTIPTYFRTEIVPVNKRVKNYNIDYIDATKLHEIELVADTPVK
ncbi:MAG TPA: oligopeptide ABC transporter substrate-binding protein [Metalysinibacillus sp.]